jgi:CheY-like chemotaxis protein
VVKYALKLLNDNLDVSKINSGAFIANKKPFDLQRVIANATKMQLAKARHIKMSFVPSPQPCIAVSDCDIVERIVATLISNAVKFTPSGAVQPFIWPLEEVLPIANNNQEAQSNIHPVDHVSSGSGEGKGADEPLNLSNNQMSLVAVGVADTGLGLPIELLREAQSVINSDTTGTSIHGARNTGFGLYHAHLQAKALGTKLHMSSLKECHRLLNQDMVKAVIEQEKIHANDSKRTDSSSAHDAEGCIGPTGARRPPSHHGTVIFLIVPVYKDGPGALKALMEKSSGVASELLRDRMQRVFCPQPSPMSTDGTFHILVADDVCMIRKGIVNIISNLWSAGLFECPVAVSTACTAEDVLRAAKSQLFDLIICDHHFSQDARKLKAICPDGDELASANRPFLRFDDSATSQEMRRRNASAFFEEERFTIEAGDGALLGFEALINLAQTPDPPFPTPVLMLVSGNKIELDESAKNLGIIVALKPLNQSEFLTHLKYIERFLKKVPSS